MRKLRYLFILILSLAISCIHAQQVKEFPETFVGTWKGKLQWMVAGNAVREFTMQLKVQPADSAGHYNWHMSYGDDNRDSRPYLLKPVDIKKGYWVIDENDGIILDSYVHGNSIHGAFTVLGKTIVDNYRIENNRMFVEFFSINLAEKTTSGKGSSEVPYVDSYKISGYQVGLLDKVE